MCWKGVGSRHRTALGYLRFKSEWFCEILWKCTVLGQGVRWFVSCCPFACAQAINWGAGHPYVYNMMLVPEKSAGWCWLFVCKRQARQWKGAGVDRAIKCCCISWMQGTFHVHSFFPAWVMCCLEGHNSSLCRLYSRMLCPRNRGWRFVGNIVDSCLMIRRRPPKTAQTKTLRTSWGLNMSGHVSSILLFRVGTSLYRSKLQRSGQASFFLCPFFFYSFNMF